MKEIPSYRLRKLSSVAVKLSIKIFLCTLRKNSFQFTLLRASANKKIFMLRVIEFFFILSQFPYFHAKKLPHFSLDIFIYINFMLKMMKLNGIFFDLFITIQIHTFERMIMYSNVVVLLPIEKKVFSF